MLRRIPNLVLIFYHAILFGVCITNVLANNFYIKDSRFFPGLLFSADILVGWIKFAPLLFPLWIKILNFRLSTERKNLSLILLFLLGSLLFSFPFSYLSLVSDQNSPGWSNIIYYLIRDGLTQPAAFVFLVGGLLKEFPVRKGWVFKSDPIITTLFLTLFIGLLLNVVCMGPAQPRLEDEIAYHIQSLIFNSGRLKAPLILPSDIEPVTALKSLIIPFIIYGPDGYYSAHLHGWSAILALFSLVKLKGLANGILTLINFPIFVFLARKFFNGREQTGFRISLFLFTVSPILLLLANTFMAHTAALSLSMLALLVWFEFRRKHERSNARPVLWLYFPLLVVIVIILAFVRFQVMVPVMFAILMGELLELLQAFLRSSRDKRKGEFATLMRMSILRMAILVFSASLALLALYGYSTLFGKGDFVFMSRYMERYLIPGCQALGFGEGYGCFPTYGTMGHSGRKFLLNLGDIMARYNQELSGGGLPLFLVFIVLLLRNGLRLIRENPFAINLIILLVIQTTIFGLYFHNGGESYRGRYLVESSFALFIILGLLIDLEISKRLGDNKERSTGNSELPGGSLVIGALFLVPMIVLFQIRGAYFNPYLRDFRSVQNIKPGINNSLIEIGSVDLAGNINSDGVAIFENEFDHTKKNRFSREQMKRVINMGFPMAVATATRIDARGYFRDDCGNVFLDKTSVGELPIWKKFLGTRESYRLDYLPLALKRKGWGRIRFWSTVRVRLEKTD